MQPFVIQSLFVKKGFAVFQKVLFEPTFGHRSLVIGHRFSDSELICEMKGHVTLREDFEVSMEVLLLFKYLKFLIQ